MLLRVIDLETTGLAPPSEVVEVGVVDVSADGSTWKIGRAVSCLFRAANGISPETMAIHHITEEDFGPDTRICSEDDLRSMILGKSKPDVLVAHNCEFERQFISENVTDDIPWICTQKVALHVWPNAPHHSNQVLRYWRGMRLDPAQAMPPHRAGPDAWVTAHLLADLLQGATVDQMIAWTKLPKALPTIPFGKHRGLKWSELPADYLQWMLRQADMNSDALYCARSELERRASTTPAA